MGHIKYVQSVYVKVKEPFPAKMTMPIAYMLNVKDVDQHKTL